MLSGTIDMATIYLPLPSYVHIHVSDEFVVNVKPRHRFGLDDVWLFREEILVREFREQLLEMSFGRMFVCAGFVFVST